MQIICLDGKTYSVKYIQSKETITTEIHTGVYNFPQYNGSKIFHNSSSSDRISLNFAIHSTQLLSFKESIKKIVINESEAIDNQSYGKLLRIVIEHPLLGAIEGGIVGGIKYNTSSEADIVCSCIFAVHTPDEITQKKDIQNENTNAVNAIDTETTDNFDVEISIKDKSTLGKLAENLESLYSNIQNSAIVSAFNDLNSELNAVYLDSQRIMNAFKNIISLPNSIFDDNKSRLELLQLQAKTIISIPANSFNMTIFNANALSYNLGISTQTAFISDSALEEAAGLKTVNLK